MIQSALARPTSFRVAAAVGACGVYCTVAENSAEPSCRAGSLQSNELAPTTGILAALAARYPVLARLQSTPTVMMAVAWAATAWRSPAL